VFSARRLDPGTALLIESLQVGERDAVLDLGCGWGPIGIAAAALAPAGRAWLVDPNPRAVEIAKQNAALNGLTNVEVLHGEGTEPVRGLLFDVIATNPPIRAGKSVVFRLIEQAAACTKPGGSFYLVARTKQGAKTIAQKIGQVFGNVKEVRKGGGYRVFAAQALQKEEERAID
jgi:16S rRNA (guanine1207-N2)-methyltransferase